MHPEYWEKRWADRKIGFHSAYPHQFLIDHLDQLNLPQGARILVPMCGKTLDIGYLLSQGYRVVGVELIDSVVRELFAELHLEPEIDQIGDLTLYSVRDDSIGIDVYAGDFFTVRSHILGRVDAVYDRGALVALQSEVRGDYARHLVEISRSAPQMLVSYFYDQKLLTGPPFSLTDEQIRSLYGPHYSITEVASRPVEGPLRDRIDRGHPVAEEMRILTNSLEASAFG